MMVARSLDDLDRIAFRLSRTVRTQYPHLLTHGFTLADLEERLLPYREVRREMANAGTDAFEIALLRLVSGERGYVMTDPELQRASRDALLMSSPTVALIRSHATTSLTLAPVANTVGAERVAPPTDQVRPTSPSPASSLATQPDAPARAAERSASGSAQSANCGCRFCGNRLPERRSVTFCPHCGMDLTKRQCPACSTQLEVSWRFCVTCGRSAELPEMPARTERPATPARAAS